MGHPPVLHTTNRNDIVSAQMSGKEIADYGVPVGFTLILLFFVGKKVFPFFQKQFERQAAQLETAHADNRKFVETANADIRTLAMDFLKALERRDEEFAKLIVSLDHLTDNVGLLTDKIELLIIRTQK